MDLNIKPKNIEIVKENIGEIFHGISLGNNFLLDMS
jgi:hypothetical protein